MKRALSPILIGLLCLSTFSAFALQVKAQETTLFFDDFESYAVGTLPSPPWEFWFNTNEEIVSTTYVSPTKSLRVVEGGAAKQLTSFYSDNPHAFRDSRGVIWILFRSNKEGGNPWGIWYQTSTDDGFTWSQPKLLTVSLSPPAGFSERSVSAMEDSKGRIWVTFSNLRSVGGGDADIYYIYSDDHGLHWSSPKRPYSGFSPWNGYDAPTIIESSGTIWIFFQHMSSIMFVKTTDRGLTWTEPRRILGPGWPSSPEYFLPRAIHTSNDDIWVFASRRQTDGKGPGDIIYIKSTDGGATWSEPRKILSVDSYGAWTRPYSVETLFGDISVFYDNVGIIFYVTSSDKGVSWSEPVQFTTISSNAFSATAVVTGTKILVFWANIPAGSQTPTIWYGELCARAWGTTTPDYQLTTNPLGDRGPSWSPDGTKIVYVAFADSWHRSIWVMNNDGSSKTQLTSGSDVAEYPAFSPDGTKIAFERWGFRGDYSDLMIMDADGSNVRRITYSGIPGKIEGTYGHPRWSNDGTKLIFHYMEGTTASPPQSTPLWIGTINIDGTDLQVLGRGSYPTFCYDDTKILFCTDECSTGALRVALMNADGTGVQLLTDGPHDNFPHMSSTTHRILFNRNINLYVMNEDGSGLTPITSDGTIHYAEWSPDERYVVYYSTRSGNCDIWKMETPPTAPPVAPDFEISVDPSSQTVTQGSSTTTTVTVSQIGGYSYSVSLSASNQPGGVTISFSPSSGTPSFTSTMNVQVASNVPIGTYPIIITGTGSDGKTYTRTYTLTIVAPPPAQQIVSKKEAEILAEIARKQSSYFKSISNFLKNRIDPSKYIEDMANEWENLGEELLPKPSEIPLQIILKIFKADEVKTIGDLCIAIIVPFKSLSDVTFWREFWLREELKGRILSITDKLDRLEVSCSKEAELWDKIGGGSGSVEELLRCLVEKKQAIEELKDALNSHIPAILEEFKVSPFEPITITNEDIKEDDHREYNFELHRQPEFIEIEVTQTPRPSSWQFWLTPPEYEMTLFFWNFAMDDWEKLWMGQRTGTTLRIGPEFSTVIGQIGVVIPVKLKLEVDAKDLGMDNWLTFWTDEGRKEAHIEIIMKHGREEKSYKDIYAYQAQALEDFWKALNNYLGYQETITQRTIDLS